MYLPDAWLARTGFIQWLLVFHTHQIQFTIMSSNDNRKCL